MSKIIAEIISIGDELLYGQTVNTNASWIGAKLSDIGVFVNKVSTISDSKSAIKNTIEEALKNSNIVIITGGLGPTNDDITKHSIAELFDAKLIMNDEALEMVTEFFKPRGRELTELNRQQALLPHNCVMIPNLVGTAPGMWFEQNGKVLVSMPGVPREMKKMMEDTVLPRLKSQFELPFILHKYVQTVGIPESILAEKIADWEKHLPASIRLAYLPSLGMVKLRLTALGYDLNEMEALIDSERIKLKNIISEFIYSFEDTDLLHHISALLKEKKMTISTAESCTGGFVAHQLTSVSGSSNYFMGAVISYDNSIKVNDLGVNSEILQSKGAVSEEVAIQMAEGVRKRMKTDIAVSTTGIAGPDGGTAEKPVGTVWIAYSDKKGTVAKKLQLGNLGRLANIELTAIAVLNLIRKQIQ